MALSEKTRKQILSMDLEQLNKAAVNVLKRIHIQSMLSITDLNVARYEPPSDAVDAVIDRNTNVMMQLQELQKAIRNEITAKSPVVIDT